MIFAHGSMREFWSQSEPGADPMALQSAIREARLSYHLLVARKT
jgi:hypothetical protein